MRFFWGEQPMALDVVKASAGTGKTYRLTLTYLQLLMGNADGFDPMAFSHILAVTFTNKATEEMKSRILGALESLSKGNKESMTEDLCRLTSLDFGTLQARAKVILKTILHQYSYFSVSTLDAFFQRIIHAFMLEAGLGTGYSVELDTQWLLDKTARQVVDNVSEDESLRQWLGAMVEERVRGEKKWDLHSLVVEVGKVAIKESFRALGTEFSNKLSDRTFLKDYLTQMNAIMSHFKQQMAEYGRHALAVMSEQGVDPSSFPYGKASFAQYFVKICQPKDPSKDFIPGKRVLQALENPESWYTKSTCTTLEHMEPLLRPILQKAYQCFLKSFADFMTADVIKANLPQMGLVADIITTMRSIQEQDNVLDIGDSTYLLSQLVGDGNSPFVYEKIGSFYNSFLLDEFQDTSVIQWKNIRPLLCEGLAKGADSLVVGDVKQSIYRWRNSDWSILGEQIERDEDLGRQKIRLSTLNTNRRSRSTIIDFVNLAVEQLKNAFTDSIRRAAQESVSLSGEMQAYLCGMLEEAYAHHHLDYPPGSMEREPGRVVTSKVECTPEKTSREWVLDQLPHLLAELQERGYAPSDIVILIRKKTDGQQIMESLMEYQRGHPQDPYCYDLVSPDSLRLNASAYVQLCVALLRKVLFSKDERNNMLVESLLGQCHSETVDQEKLLTRLRSLSLPDALETMIRVFGWNTCTDALPYLQDLHDIFLSFASSESGGLYSFLKWWDQKGGKVMLSSQQTNNAIRLMTIHKAKGLEAPVVIIPFCNWNIGGRGNQIWVHPDQPVFNQLELLPVPFSANLLNTHFAKDYLLEEAQTLLDNLNTLYVALTRPRDELYLFVPLDKDSAAASLFYDDACWGDFGSPLSKEAIAQLPSHRADTFTGHTYKLDQYPSQDVLSAITLAYQEDPFTFSADDSMRQWGIVLHKALSRIRVLQDIPQVLEQLVAEGEMMDNVEQINKYAVFLEKELTKEKVREWFDGSWRVRNEASLLGRYGTLRPDRVMEKDGRVVVVDYKFGKREPAHQRQMQRYVDVLKRMGYEQVEGHLWYLTLSEVSD